MLIYGLADNVLKQLSQAALACFNQHHASGQEVFLAYQFGRIIQDVAVYQNGGQSIAH
jgi:hypothetical protein